MENSDGKSKKNQDEKSLAKFFTEKNTYKTSYHIVIPIAHRNELLNSTE